MGASNIKQLKQNCITAFLLLILSLCPLSAVFAATTIQTSYTTNETMEISSALNIKGEDTVFTVGDGKKIIATSAAGIISLEDGATLKTNAQKSLVIKYGVKSSTSTDPTSRFLNFTNGGTAIASFDNEGSITGVIAIVSGDCTIKRCAANRTDDTFFYGNTKPWHIRANPGTKLLIDANEGKCILNNKGHSFQIYDYKFPNSTISDGALPPCELSFKINGNNSDPEGWLKFNNASKIAITNKLDFVSDNTGVFEFLGASHLNGPRYINSSKGNCVLVINEDAQVRVYNVDFNNNESRGRICGNGIMNIIASNSSVSVTADFPNEVRLSTTNIVNSLELRKYGLNELFLNAPTVQKLTIKEGDVIVRENTHINQLIVEPGAKIIVDGAELRFYGEITPNQIEFRNGGTAHVAITGEEKDPNAIFREEGMCRLNLKTYNGLIKTGARELVIYDPCEITGKIHVQGGALRFSKRSGISDKYIRFTAKECYPTGKDKNSYAGLALKVGLYDAEDKIIDLGDATSIYVDKPVSEFPSNSFSAPNPNALIKETANFPEPAGAFAMRSFTNKVSAANNTVDPNYMPIFINSTQTICRNANNSDGWIVILGRLPDDMRAMDGSNIASIQGFGLLKTWTIETSQTGLDGSWRIIQDIIDSPRAQNRPYEGFLNDNRFKPAYHFRYVAPGFSGLADKVQIEVDDGAELDFSSKNGGQIVNEITIGTSAGIAKAVVFAENGSIQINDGQSTALANGYLPLVIENVQKANNLSRWTVYHNGKQLHKTVAYDSAAKKLLISGAKGLYIEIR